MRRNTVFTSLFATSLLCASLGLQAAKGSVEVVSSAPLNYQQILLQAQQADSQAQYKLAFAFSSGIGLPRDDQKARHWYERAAKLGLAKAQYQLALMHEYGQGDKSNYGQAKHYYNQAAQQGHADAQYALARLYLSNKVGDKNPTKAWTYLALAENNGMSSVANLKDLVGQSLSPTELSAAEQAFNLLKSEQPRKQTIAFASIAGR